LATETLTIRANPGALKPRSYHPGIEADNYRYKAVLETSEAFEMEGQTIQTEQWKKCNFSNSVRFKHVTIPSFQECGILK
jgi:hypothetical protein